MSSLEIFCNAFTNISLAHATRRHQLSRRPLSRARCTIIARRAARLRPPPILTTRGRLLVASQRRDSEEEERQAREQCRGPTGATRTSPPRTRRRWRPRCGSTSTTQRPSATPSRLGASTPPCTPTRSSRTPAATPIRSSTSSRSSKPTPRGWCTRAAMSERSSWRRSTTRTSAASASSTTRPERASSRLTKLRAPRSNCLKTPTQRTAMLLAREILLPMSGSRQLTRCTRRQTSQAEATAEQLFSRLQP